MKLRKKIGILSLGTILLLAIGLLADQNAHAANPDAFIVEVIPSSFDVNEPVDLTIKAVKADGSIIKDYLGDVFIEIEGIVDTADYTVPSDGLYTFQPQDQGVKLFSKGLSIKKSGTFTIKVSDIINDKIVGKKTVIVGTTNNNINTTEKITIISPVAGGIEKNNVINIIASTPSLKNSPYEIYINNILVNQGITSVNGDISTYASGINEGENILQIKILNAMNEIIGESDIVTFNYQPIKDGVFNSIIISPTNIKQGQKATFTVKSSESVTSAQIKLSDGKTVPMDKQGPGNFTKDILMDTKGKIQVDVELIVLGQTKNYTGVATLYISEGTAIGKVRIYSDSVDKTKLHVTRETIGSAVKYRIDYGTSQSNLNISAIVQTNEIIIENLSLGETYYFQITPLDTDGNSIGTPSDIIETKVGSNLNCIVVGIKITTGQIGEKYYLMRSGVANVEKYIIYRSDFETNDVSKMQKIGETTETMFEYPFNPNPASRQYKYAYYLVEAVCKDGTSIRIDNAKKIVVGPTENILLIILISLFAYVGYKLYTHSNK